MGKGKQVVHCHGVFDLLHVGHLRHFEARRFGDVLIVTLTPDRWVNKGPLRPAFDEQLRLEMLSGLSCIDFVGLNEWPTAVETITRLKPSVFVKGSEFVDRSKTSTRRDREGRSGGRFSRRATGVDRRRHVQLVELDQSLPAADLERRGRSSSVDFARSTGSTTSPRISSGRRISRCS